MPTYFRFGFGPFRFSQRMGRTQAQKRAAARARAQRSQARAEARRHQQWEREYYAPEAVAAREAAQADHDARTYRGVITKCQIDGIKGGEFTIEADGRPDMSINVGPNLALRFLSLKNGDIVQVTLGPDDAGLEEFWHLSRANGAKPRSPADFGPGELLSRRSDDQPEPREQREDRAPVGNTITWTAETGDGWKCDHHHPAKRDADRCATEHQLEEYANMERELRSMDTATMSEETRARLAETLEQVAEKQRQAMAELRELGG